MEKIQIIEAITLNNEQKVSLFNLWNNEYPVELTYNSIDDFELYFQKLINVKHTLLVDEVKKIKGWTFSFDRENARWFVIIISSTIQSMGFGRKMMQKLQAEEQKLFGWVTNHNNYKKINGQNYLSPIKFYEKCGFIILADQILELEKISAIKIIWKKDHK